MPYFLGQLYRSGGRRGGNNCNSWEAEALVLRNWDLDVPKSVWCNGGTTAVSRGTRSGTPTKPGVVDVSTCEKSRGNEVMRRRNVPHNLVVPGVLKTGAANVWLQDTPDSQQTGLGMKQAMRTGKQRYVTRIDH